MPRRLASVFRTLFRRAAADRALDEEVAATVEILAAERRRQGVPSAEAHRQALLELGGIEQVKDRTREARTGRFVADFVQDLRYGARLLARAPSFTLVAALTLGIGIGATTTVFSWVRTTLLEPLPGVPRQHEIVVIATRDRAGDVSDTLSYPTWTDYASENHSFVGLTGATAVGVALRFHDSVERAIGALVSDNYFALLGVRPALGRAFLPEETAPGGRAVVVLSDGYWRRRFAADPAVVGQAVSINGLPFVVVGVAQPGFVGDFAGMAYSFWAPLSQQPSLIHDVDRTRRGDRWLLVRGRLKPGVSIDAARADLAGIAARIERADPAANKGRQPLLTSLWQSPEGSAPGLRPVLGILGAVVGLVLLLACANVANLLLVRGLGRQHEIALRLAIGAGRWRLVRQLAAETLLLALLGAAGGVAIAWFAVDQLTGFVPSIGVPIYVAVGLDWTALAFAGAITLLAVVGTALVPALGTVRTGFRARLDADNVRSIEGGGRSPLRHGLVIVQVALSMTLVAGAGLFLRSLLNATTLNPGFDARGMLIASLELPRGYDQRVGTRLFTRVLERARALPGVRSAAMARQIPMSIFGYDRTTLSVDGYQPPTDEPIVAALNVVSPDYFRTLSIPLVDGRDFSERDAADAPLAVIVNQAMVERFWHRRNPVGSTLTLLGGRRGTIVGVARNSKYFAANEVAEPFLYVPYLQMPTTDIRLHIRVAGDPAQAAPAVRAAVGEIDPALAVADIEPMSEHLRFAFLAQRLTGSLLAVFGALAVALAALGLYGVMAYNVSRRTRELGLRMALGASASDVWRMVIGQGVRLFVIGLPVGLAGAVALGYAARSQLYGVTPSDPLSLIGAMSILSVVLLAATAIPAWRASHLDPVAALTS